MAALNELATYIRCAIKCGPVPVLRDVHALYEQDPAALTLGEKVILFAEMHLRVPEGVLVGRPLTLSGFQKVFLLAVIDNPEGTRDAVLSIARRNGKTFILAVLILAYLIGPLASKNATIASAAQSRDQAALLFNLMSKMIHMSPDIEPHLRIVPSSKRVVSLTTNSEYYAMSADAKTGYGRALRVVVLDESGQIRGEVDEYVDMLRTSQGSYEDPLFVTISTQAPSDRDWLSVMMDDGIRSQDPHTVIHLYCADEDGDILDEAQWLKANPGLGVFRVKKDLEEQLKRAVRLPAQQSGALNLLLNRRVSQVSLWLGPIPWRECGGDIDLDVFRYGKVAVGIDLSARQDLTAAVLAAADESGVVHLLPFCYTPMEGLEERSRRDRTPYDVWVREGKMIAVAGANIEYIQVAEHLKDQLESLRIMLDTIEYDRWNWKYFEPVAREVGLVYGVTVNEVGQGYQSFTPRVNNFESLLLRGKIRHGNHPLLTMAASNAIAVGDPAGNKKLDKSKSTARIDPLVASVMAAFPVSEGAQSTRSMYEDESRRTIM